MTQSDSHSVTSRDHTVPFLPAEASRPAWWLRSLLPLAGGAVLLEAGSRLLPLDGGSLLTAGILAGGWWLLSRRRSAPTPRRPASVSGWLERCSSLLERFDRLEGEAGSQRQRRRRARMDGLRLESDRTELRLALVGSRPPDLALQPRFSEALRCRQGLILHWGLPLPTTSRSWTWPEALESCDLLLYHLPLPLAAADLRWLEALPEGMPAWLLLQTSAGADRQQAVDELISQWPDARPERLLFWDGHSDPHSALQPLSRHLTREGASLRAATPLRCFQQLHRRWQAELEGLRRREWRDLQQRTQWLVAAGVFAAPMASVDVVILAVANGLMLREMARLWDCPWSLEQLRTAALELGRASLALGVVEWSSQALAAAGKLHGATWLLGGAVQALSAAYLTRVVSRAMADVLALSAGVEAPDLERIKREAPLLVARAAETEKLDWQVFLGQARRWSLERGDDRGTARGRQQPLPAS